MDINADAIELAMAMAGENYIFMCVHD